MTRDQAETFDIVSIDAKKKQKKHCNDHYEKSFQCVKKNGLIPLDNVGLLFQQ